MTSEWFLANIPYDATEQEIRDFVRSARVDPDDDDSGVLVSRVRPIHDFETGKFRGYAFAEVDVPGGPEDEDKARRSIFGKVMVRKSDGKEFPVHVERSRNPRRAGLDGLR